MPSYISRAKQTLPFHNEENETQDENPKGGRRGEGQEAKQMAEAPSKIESMRKWIVDHKLRAVALPLAYWDKQFDRVQLVAAQYEDQRQDHPRKVSFSTKSACHFALKLKFKQPLDYTLILDDPPNFARGSLHAQALTLAALVGSACVEYYDQKYGSSGPKVDKYTSQYLAHSHKD
ncbi:hypothetical protein ACP70R_026711 [Stipagrostis hirtigluma subsp. patula]